MRPGERYAGRYEVLRRVAKGGFGTVYCARDAETGREVALKLLEEVRPGRFATEVQLLEELNHPAIVRYVDHGVTDEAHYIVTEWLEGGDLWDHLDVRGGAMAVDDCVALLRGICAALAEAHQRGIVHRDLKPANVILVDHDPAKVKLIDFGIAHLSRSDRTRVTRSGEVIGTPGYMAPEQATGDAEIDARADVFALGCLAYECLAGQPPFEGKHAMAVLVKLLFEEPQPLAELAPEAPADLVALVEEMLAKEPEGRPPDASAVLARLQGALGAPAASRRPQGLSTEERRVVSVVLARGLRSVGQGTTVNRSSFLAQLQATGAQLVALRDGTLAFFVSSAGTATDRATAAARLALTVRDAQMGMVVALATGLAATGERSPVGEVIDRATELLVRARQRLMEAPSSREHGLLAIDDASDALVDAELVRSRLAGLTLLRGRRRGDAPRKLLGKPAPFVGRRSDLAIINAHQSHALEEGAARALVVVAAEGVGKTRLRNEWLVELDDVTVWMARCDAQRSEEPWAMAAEVLCGHRVGMPPLERRALVTELARDRLGPERGERAALFLCEVVRAPHPPGEDLELDAARRDPSLMGTRVAEAFAQVVAAAAGEGLVLVIDDLQWTDRPSLALIEAALQACEALPFFVLALGRPSLDDRVPDLWASGDVHRHALGPLSRRATERMVRAALEGVGDDVVGAIAERAEGNAFFVEELIRFNANPSAAIPETLRAVLLTRLERRSEEARRVLRAASVFGLSFDREGVARLVGASMASPSLAEALAELETEELIRDDGEGSYTFHHDLVRQSAYDSLTDEDRRLGHALAAGWTEKRHPDRLPAIAEHWRLGGEVARAASAYAETARAALEAGDFHAVLEAGEQAASCGLAGRDDAVLQRRLAEASFWLGDLNAAARRARRARAGVDAADDAWADALGILAVATTRLGDAEEGEQVAQRVAAQVAAGATEPLLRALANAASVLNWAGRPAAASRLLTAVPADLAPPPAVQARMLRAKAQLALLEGDLSAAMDHFAAASSAFATTGDRRNACYLQVSLGASRVHCGLLEEGEALLRQTLDEARGMRLASVARIIVVHLAQAVSWRGRREEALALLDEGEDREPSMAIMAGFVRVEALVALGRIEEAATAAAGLGGPSRPLDQTLALAAASLVARALEDHEEAVARAREAVDLGDESLRWERGAALRAFVEALQAAGQDDEAARVAREAVERLQAAPLRDEHRRSYLEDVPDNRALVAASRPGPSRG